MRLLSSHTQLLLRLRAVFGGSFIAFSMLAVSCSPAAATAMVSVDDAGWNTRPWIFDTADGMAPLPNDGVLTCFGGATSYPGGCSDVRALSAVNPFASVKTYSVISDGGFTIKNNSDITFNSVSDFSQPRMFLDFIFSACSFFCQASVTNPSSEYAFFSSSVYGAGIEEEGQLDFASCDTRGGGVQTGRIYFFSSGGISGCAGGSPDFSEGIFGFVPLLAPGDTFTAYYEIAINAELKGSLAVPEPTTLPLFVTGLGLMALLAWRRSRMGPSA
jgi:hypothetical protein